MSHFGCVLDEEVEVRICPRERCYAASPLMVHRMDAFPAAAIRGAAQPFRLLPLSGF